jgi:hypothetical protein
MTEEEATKAGTLLGLDEDAIMLLQQVPYKGSIPTAVGLALFTPFHFSPRCFWSTEINQL